MEYEIIEEKIHIFFDDRKTVYAFWPEELIQIVEAQETGALKTEIPGLADLASTVLEEHPEVFTCHYNSDVIV